MDEARSRFDVGRLEREPLPARLLMAAARYPYLQLVMDAARWWTPAVRVSPRLTVVLRHDDVRRVLGDSEAFQVPWGWKMKLVTGGDDHGGRNFVLGMNGRDEVYRLDHAMLAQAFAYRDTFATLREQTVQVTDEILSRHEREQGQPFDAIEGLVTAVPAALCGTYYGLTVLDPGHFAKCTLAVSSFVFGTGFDPTPQDRPDAARAMALEAAPEIRRVIRRSIADAKIGQADRPLERLLADTRHGLSTADHEDLVHAQLFGMVLGFIPTNVLAGGNILETLLRRPDFMAKVVEAADHGDDDLLWRCLRETLRFRNINFGPLRECKQDTRLEAEGGSVLLRTGDRILASTQSAMFDRRRIRHPHVFDSGRPDQDYLSFGVGQHWCIGAYIAQVQLTQMFRQLFRRFEVRPLPGQAGRMRRFRVFPLHMDVELVRRAG